MTPAPADVELLIGGMTCASCAARIEKKLNRLDGVTATVNYATEKAKVTYGPTASRPRTSSPTVEKTGYTAALPGRRAEEPPTRRRGARAASLRRAAARLRGADRAGDRDGDGARPGSSTTGSGCR